MDEARDEYIFDDDLSQEETSPTFSISCTNVPDSLLNGEVAEKHFGKFGTAIKILLRPKNLSCIVDYETRDAAERAILNGGAFDGFEFNVTWNKLIKRPTKVSDDPEWLPDPEVAAELASMIGDYPRFPRLNRQQKMDMEHSPPAPNRKLHVKKKTSLKPSIKPSIKPSVLKTKMKALEPKEARALPVPAPTVVRNIDRDEVRQLISKQWVTSEDKMKALECRDRLVRARLATRRGAICGSCPDMCPERERLTRQAQRQVAAYEFDQSDVGSNRMDPLRAVKQYSRSSADQEEPLTYDLRPVPVLQRTLVYLLANIMDLCDEPETSIGDWFHFLWDRLRAIRKDITQQALCCRGSVTLVEACARFHAHCAARLVEEPASSFDQRLNTENLSKCLQTLKYMYGDLRTRGDSRACANEPEFRTYVVLLNMQDANFMWEVQQLDPAVQSSPEIRFAIKVFTAIDNNNYIKFFKLVKETTYLNACILTRYFNDIRARALTRMIKSHSPRGMSQFPALKLMDMLAFESMNSMEVFLEHYGLEMQTAADDDYSYVILDKNAFCDNSTPCAQERVRNLVESKRDCSLGELIYGGELPVSHFEQHPPHSSFDARGYLKREAILAQDQGYKPPPGNVEEVKNILKNATMTSKQEGKQIEQRPAEKHADYTFAKPETVKVFNQPRLPPFNASSNPVAVNPFKIQSSNAFKSKVEDFEKKDNDEGKNIFRTENKFIFSKPAVTEAVKNIWQNSNQTENIFSKSSNEPDSAVKCNIFGSSVPSKFLFSKPEIHPSNIFSHVGGVRPPVTKTASSFDTSSTDQNNIFKNAASKFPSTNLFNPSPPMGNTPFPSNYPLPNSFLPPYNKFKPAEDEKIRQELEEAKKKQDEELRKQQEAIKEELRCQQEELKKRAKENQAELERKEAERKRKELEAAIERQLQEIVPGVINEAVNDMCEEIIREELCRLEDINNASLSICEDILMRVCEEECETGLRAAIRLREIRLRIITRSTARCWRKQVAKSRRRRSLLHATPAWLPSRTPPAPISTQNDALLRMRNFHRKKKFTFETPLKPERHAINLFETVKKSLMRISQDVDRNSHSLNLYWKIVTSMPDEQESPDCSMFLQNWISEVFSDTKQPLKSGLVYLNEHSWHMKFAISVCNIYSAELQTKKQTCLDKVAGLNGFIFYGDLRNNKISVLIERIQKALMLKCKLQCIPIALVLLSETSQSFPGLESHLAKHKNSGTISDYKLFTIKEFSDRSVSSSTREALQWLARRYPSKPLIESNLLSTYLDQCIGSELWYRFKLSLHSSFRDAFQDTQKIISLYNEAVNKAARMVSDPELQKYPTFPQELSEFLHYDNVYPKDYEYFPKDWKSNLRTLSNIITTTFTLPYYTGEWPPCSVESFQKSLRQYVKNLQWFSDAEKITLKIFSIMEDFGDESEDRQFISFLDIMKILISGKILEPIKMASTYSTVIYCKKDLYDYRTTPWWCKSDVVKDVSPAIDDYYDDDFDVLEISASKKPRMDFSEEMPEDAWMTSVLSDMDTSIQQGNKCHEMFSDIEKNIEKESVKHARMEQLLLSALQDG